MIMMASYDSNDDDNGGEAPGLLYGDMLPEPHFI